MKSAATSQSLIDSAVPQETPPLDDSFRPAFLANRAFQRAVAESGKGVPLVLGLERSEHALTRFETTVFPDGHPSASENLWYAERLLKFLLWARGAWRVHVGGPESIVRHLRETYSPKGTRAFDFHFMGEDVYRRTFAIVGCDASAVPAERHQERSLGRHLRGCRIGFDLGASDLKVSAVVDGQPVFSKEIEWQPREHRDPRYHRHMILSALHLAAAHLPRIDAIGGSSAGVYVDSQPRIASLFRGIPKERYGDVREMFVRIRGEFGVPLDVVNDGEVTALAGSMSLEDDSILGVALGSSEAAGYITPQGNDHGLAERARVRAGRLRARGAGRRVVGRPRLRRPVLLAAVRLPARRRASGSRSPATSRPPRSSSSCSRSSTPGTRARGGSGRRWASTWATASPTTRSSTR